MAPAFEKRKGFCCEVNRQGGKAQICFLHPGFGESFYGLGRVGWYSETLEGQVSMGSLGNLTIYGKIW